MDLNSCKENSSRERKKILWNFSPKKSFFPNSTKYLHMEENKISILLWDKKKKDTDEDEENSKKKEVEDWNLLREKMVNGRK